MARRSSSAVIRSGFVAEAHRLIDEISVLAEKPMRRAALAERFQRMGALRALWTLETIIRGALLRRERALACYDVLVQPEPLLAELDETLLDGMLQAGVQERCIAALQWVRATGLRETDCGQDIERLVAKELREMTLGDRRALARRAGVDQLKALAMDPDPGVITNLLNNPRTTEDVVITVCARRPTVSAPLEAVLHAPKWNTRYRVRLALCQNPHIRSQLAINLLVYLTAKDLQAICTDGSLSSDVRLGAQRLIDLLVDNA